MTRLGINLHETTDAMDWVEEFDRTYPDHRPDNDTMLGWFANAIEVGRSAGIREAERRLRPPRAGEE